MREVSRSEGVTIITSTHDRLVMEMADRVEELANGRHVAAKDLLRTVTARERSPSLRRCRPTRLPAASSRSRTTPGGPARFIGADAAQFARPVAADAPAEPSPLRRDEAPPADQPGDDVTRWAPPDRG
ncbi:MAG: hypothetical protein U0531_10385 [Dehalococcoidia bacterium]